eukprot:scaffold72447_cov26-Tisochrysis_lutea.AAC.1
MDSTTVSFTGGLEAYEHGPIDEDESKHGNSLVLDVKELEGHALEWATVDEESASTKTRKSKECRLSRV